MPEVSGQQDFDRGMAWDALERANKAVADGLTHEAVCAERYENINGQISGLRSEIKGIRSIFIWSGGALFTLLLAVFGFLINQVNSSNAQLADRNNAAAIAASRIDLLQQTLANERRVKSHTEQSIDR